MTQFIDACDGSGNPLPGQIAKQSLTADFDFRQFRHCRYYQKSITWTVGIMPQTQHLSAVTLMRHPGNP